MGLVIKFLTQKLAIAFVGLILWSGTAMAIGFATGNSFEARKLSGDIRVVCSGRPSRYHRCERWTLFPAEYVYFSAPGVDADRVELISTQESGRVVKDSSKFLSEKGLSKDRFNLWIETLFQTALLDAGVNKVWYKLTKVGVIVKEGEVLVIVSVNPNRDYCPEKTIFSSDKNDCKFPSRRCSTYFSRLNYSCN